jgi:hypothetical protein
MKRTDRLVDKVIANLRGETAKPQESKSRPFQEAFREAVKMGQPLEEEKETFHRLIEQTKATGKLLCHAPSGADLKVFE